MYIFRYNLVPRRRGSLSQNISLPNDRTPNSNLMEIRYFSPVDLPKFTFSKRLGIQQNEICTRNVARPNSLFVASIRIERNLAQLRNRRTRADSSEIKHSSPYCYG